jgi:hypothetical protein
MEYGPTPPPSDVAPDGGLLPRPMALLVRRSGRWWYPHELPLLATTDDGPTHDTT